MTDLLSHLTDARFDGFDLLLIALAVALLALATIARGRARLEAARQSLEEEGLPPLDLDVRVPQRPPARMTATMSLGDFCDLVTWDGIDEARSAYGD
jgi:hypothetical protein